MTIDQRASRRRGDLVEDLLAGIHAHLRVRSADALVLGFERTAGDEVQGVLGRSGPVIDLTLHLLRLGGWSVGIGAGAVDHPLGSSSRASTGPAFVAARGAVERARTRAVPVPVAVAGEDPEAAADAEAVLHLLGGVLRRRSAEGWAAIDAVGSGRQRDAAVALGITPQAVSQRLRAAMWDEEQRVRPAAGRLLARAERRASGPAEDPA